MNQRKIWPLAELVARADECLLSGGEADIA
jgi:hypothetical protein